MWPAATPKQTRNWTSSATGSASVCGSVHSTNSPAGPWKAASSIVGQPVTTSRPSGQSDPALGGRRGAHPMRRQARLAVPRSLPAADGSRPAASGCGPSATARLTAARPAVRPDQRTDRRIAAAQSRRAAAAPKPVGEPRLRADRPGLEGRRSVTRFGATAAGGPIRICP
jgi:hypothetical protein